METEVSKEHIKSCIITHLTDKHGCPPQHLIQAIKQMCGAREQPILNGIWNMLDNGTLDFTRQRFIILVERENHGSIV